MIFGVLFALSVCVLMVGFLRQPKFLPVHAAAPMAFESVVVSGRRLGSKRPVSSDGSFLSRWNYKDTDKPVSFWGKQGLFICGTSAEKYNLGFNHESFAVGKHYSQQKALVLQAGEMIVLKAPDKDLNGKQTLGYSLRQVVEHNTATGIVRLDFSEGEHVREEEHVSEVCFHAVRAIH